MTNLRHAWQVVFYVGAAISALGGIIFMVTVRVDVLPWAKLKSMSDATNSGKDDEDKWDDEKQTLRESKC